MVAICVVDRCVAAIGFVVGGLIATNASELQALKLRGERNYIDIKLGKTKAAQRFGGSRA